MLVHIAQNTQCLFRDAMHRKHVREDVAVASQCGCVVVRLSVVADTILLLSFVLSSAQPYRVGSAFSRAVRVTGRPSHNTSVRVL